MQECHCNVLHLQLDLRYVRSAITFHNNNTKFNNPGKRKVLRIFFIKLSLIFINTCLHQNFVFVIFPGSLVKHSVTTVF